MIDFQKSEPGANKGDLAYHEWNPHSDPPRWEIVLPVLSCGCPGCDCIGCGTGPTEVTVTIYDGRCDDCGGDVTVTPLE